MAAENDTTEGAARSGWLRGLRNGVVYLVGMVIAGVGALGMLEEIALPVMIAVLIFFAGLGLVIVVHEYFDGPL